MADISKITLPSGSTYDIKDATARDLISAMSNYTAYLGVTTTSLTDEATTNPITISNKQVTAVSGNIVTKGKEEFIFNGTKWQKFGDLSALGSLAYKNTASASYKPAGAVSQPTFTGKAVSYTPEGSVTVNAYTPAGTVSKPSFTGTEQTAAGTTSSVTVSKATSGTATYTPSGSVSAPGITFDKKTASMYSITGVGSLPACTLPSLTTSVTNETLTLGWSSGSFSAGTLPTRGSAQTVLTNSSSVTAGAPIFTGDGARLVAAAGTASITFTPSGTVSQPTFTGTEAVPTASFTGTAKNITAAGDVSKPTFTGTQATITVS